MTRGRASRVMLAAIACSVLAVSAAAQKIQVQSHRDDRADFAALRTYSWLPSPPLKSDVALDAPKDPTLSQEVLGPAAGRGHRADVRTLSAEAGPKTVNRRG
jgi:hypothetical protein